MARTLMFIFGGGGHTKGLTKLSEKLGKKYNLEFVIKKDDEIAKRHIGDRPYFVIKNLREMEDRGFFIPFFKSITNSFQALSILFKSKAEVIITEGPAIAVPMCYLGKFLFRKKIIFIESSARVTHRSLTGKLIHWFADKIFVQWEPAAKNYKNAVYAGRPE